MKKVFKRIIYIILIVLIILSLLPTNYSYAANSVNKEASVDYINQLQSIDFEGMMNSSFSNSFGEYSDRFQGNSGELLDNYRSDSEAVDSNIGSSTNDLESIRDKMSNDKKKENSSISNKYKQEQKSLDSNINQSITKERKNHKKSSSLLNKFNKEEKKNKKISDGATPSGLTGSGNSLSGTPKGYGRLPSVRVGSEKRGQISSSVKRLAGQFEGLSETPECVNPVNQVNDIMMGVSGSINKYKQEGSKGKGTKQEKRTDKLNNALDELTSIVGSVRASDSPGRVTSVQPKSNIMKRFPNNYNPTKPTPSPSKIKSGC